MSNGRFFENLYNYPLLTLEKAGYTLVWEDDEYWMESEGVGTPGTYDSDTDLNLTVDSLGTVILGYDNPFVVNPSLGNSCPGQYTKWTGGKNFESQPFDMYQTSTKLSGLDSSDRIAEIEGYLSGWLTEITSDSEGRLNIVGNDIIFLNEVSELQAQLGLPLNIDDFPTP